MADTGTSKSKSGNLDPKAKQEQPEERGANEQIEQEELANLDAEVDAEAEQLEGDRIASERIEQQDLNQGMDTGTHDSTRRGINWGSEYAVPSATSRKGQEKDEPNKTSKEEEKKSTT
jgi:hypothetical protein